MTVAATSDSTYELRTRRDGSIEVTNLVEVPVTTVHDALRHIDQAFRQRAVSATDLNAHSSRSHWYERVFVMIRAERDWGKDACRAEPWAGDLAGTASLTGAATVCRGTMCLAWEDSIVTVYVASEERSVGSASFRRSKLTFVDLAGSECLALSNATGAAALETAHINKSLSALADVIMALGCVPNRSRVPRACPGHGANAPACFGRPCRA